MPFLIAPEILLFVDDLGRPHRCRRVCRLTDGLLGTSGWPTGRRAGGPAAARSPTRSPRPTLLITRMAG